MKKPKERGRFARWSAHHFLTCLFWIATLPVPVFVTDFNKTPGTKTWVVNSIPEIVLFVATTLWALSCMAMFFALIAAFHHFSNPCADCSLSFPLNAAEEAKRWQRAFEVQHKMGKIGSVVMRRVGERAWLNLVILLALPVMFIVVGVTVVNILIPEPWTASVGFALLMALLIPLLGPSKMHFTLAPWCEGCAEEGWGDDGPEEPSPEIPPLPTMTKTT